MKRRKIVVDDDDDDEDFSIDADLESAMAADGMPYCSTRIIPNSLLVVDLDDSNESPTSDEQISSSKKRKRSSPSSPMSEDLDIPSTSTALQWSYDPGATTATKAIPKPPRQSNPLSTKKQKAHMTEPENRYTWLANIVDADRNPPGHPDYDPRSIYIPPYAWNKFSPFESQYWEIKQKFWDTIVFFKKGKFYELYEKDATIGHQLFDLKLTDRVNMRMVGVPEASLDHWANQFVAKGYKIARVDQMESALGKEMRERDGKPESTTSKKPQKEEKVIRRELASVLTAGTLVEGSMLQSDMSTFCVAIKEMDRDGCPAFGIAFVDAATAQFNLTEFVDDMEMTKFETFVAQIRPSELLLEKSCLSSRAIRILKANTPSTTIWNYLKPAKEFWSAEHTTLELNDASYFSQDSESGIQVWPTALAESKEKHLVLSAFGALLQYLRLLQIDRDIVSLGNFAWYDPLRKGSTLVLDGQSLINLEIFANSFDGGTEGTLFAMLNHCVSPFGKRMLRQWVCHPLANTAAINGRLDAVESLNADVDFINTFTESLSKMPDLERLISRVHANRCKAQDFLKVLEGFEQIEYAISLLSERGTGEGIIGKLVASMPDLSSPLSCWQGAFDRSMAKQQGILVPKPGVEEDFDASAEEISQCESALESILQHARKQLGSTAICFRDNGKEIYQLEVPIKVKGIPKDWDQMSATVKVKRYYNPELRRNVRHLQEARETHAQIVKEVAGRFYKRFDNDYECWSKAVKVISQLDCLVSLARASSAMGALSCRPQMIDVERSVLEFHELRHPTLLTTVSDFIPNDILLGGSSPNINLLTGANAAGKSTVLRMTCIAVILAQLGCYVPCSFARLTPCDRIMSRLGANDNILQQQSTFFIELAETKKILNEATSRSLVILDELGRGTSSVDGLAVAEAVLHHIAGAVGCTGFFATHYHSLAHEFSQHPEVAPKRMKIDVDDEARRVTFLYRLEDGVAEGSFGMHCASMCGLPNAVVVRAEEAAGMWEHSGRVREGIEKSKGMGRIGLGWLSDVAWMLKDDLNNVEEGREVANKNSLDVLAKAIASM